SFWQIGAEGGMWDQPALVDKLVLAPAERADVLVDFSRFAGQTIVLKNHKPKAPVATPSPSLEQVMQIRVGTSVSQPGPRAIPSSLPGRKADLPNPVRMRYISLNEIYVNVTGDTHPMHTHLVTFQVVGRTPFDAQAYEEANEGPHGVPGGIDPSP